MATISYTRLTSVNPEWGVKNLLSAMQVDTLVLSDVAKKKADRSRIVSSSDIQAIAERYGLEKKDEGR